MELLYHGIDRLLYLGDLVMGERMWRKALVFQEICVISVVGASTFQSQTRVTGTGLGLRDYISVSVWGNQFMVARDSMFPVF
jgi:hypothetical protein